MRIIEPSLYSARVANTQLMRNPWLDLPVEPPFIHPDDAPILASHQHLLTDRTALKLDLRPQPWTGNLNTAEVFVLALNPGFADADYKDLRNEDYADQWRLTLTFESRTPFYLLDPAFAETSGHQWWHRRCREMIDIVGLDAVAKKSGLFATRFDEANRSWSCGANVFSSNRYLSCASTLTSD